MAVKLSEPEKLLPIKGIRVASLAAGIKKSGSDDLVLFEIADGSQTSAMFTRNVFCAAPVLLSRKHLQLSSPKYLLINAGNANAGTGQNGMEAAESCCKLVADETAAKATAVLPFSTGVIGQNLPVEKFAAAIPDLVKQLHEDSWLKAGRGIMTTDTLLKGISRQIELDGKTITITGIAKGSGMIHPDMATMLGFVATDAGVSKELLDSCLQESVQKSFNSITVDGDTSTNDSCVLMATGQSGVMFINDTDKNFEVFKEALNDVFIYLAQAIIRDGEGATKFISLNIINATSEEEARKVAYTIAHSPLVKTALFASDPNWGRILAAVGRSGISLDIDKIEIYLDDVCIVREGGRADSYTEEQGQAVMSRDEITITVDLKQGQKSAVVWTCDFSYDYVKINAEYRS
ncbi:MAG: bifunctional glutamate N-acetyltransferase/amino-acid acetyltransferase ArgJ [Gammaproteobacteria bacterium]|nr:bifunctional glutamate N-acetyltransferase/amino-acid acetyltransferase ArgJ [Gammaproteobacteria bacterium]MDH5736558.1 bifunctional glutamate N-acetyltransferase/amino-acid acetyltransferase ArgJ [Gammaproteobacteria bacterium]